jgi:hypothetical protein
VDFVSGECRVVSLPPQPCPASEPDPHVTARVGFSIDVIPKSYAAGLKMNRPGGACLKLGHQNPQ